MIYILIILLVLTFSFTEKSHKRFYVLFIEFLLSLVIGLRSWDIGIDTLSYSDLFLNANGLPFNQSFFNQINIEPGYYFLNWFCSNYFFDFQIFILLMGIFFISCVSIVIYKYSYLPWMSFYLFIAFGFFTFAMSGLRQTIAIGLTLLCFVFAKNRKPLLYTLFLIAAFLFHYSAIIFAPAYFLERIELNKRNVIVSSIVALLIFSFSSVIFIFANSYARISYEEMETGGNLMFLFYILLLILGFTQKKNLLAIDSKNSCLYYYMITTIVLFPLCKFHPALFRLTFFYSIIVFIVYVPNVLFSVKNSVVRFSFTFIICIIATYFLTYKVLLPMNKLLPYYFFWE